MQRRADRRSRRRLQALLAGLGTVATTAGLVTVARGAAGVRHGGPVSSNVDSELRFYAAWYAVLGSLLLRAALRPEDETATVAACAVGSLVGAVGRALSIGELGRPDPLFRLLMGIELAVPAIVLPWQRRVVRAALVDRAGASTTAG